MKKLICLLLCLCFVFVLAACGQTEEKTEDETTTQGGETTTPEDADVISGESKPSPTPDQDVTNEPVENNTVLYTVKVVDEAGNPVTTATLVQICDEVCVPVKLTDGVGEKSLEPNENYHVLLTSGLPEGYEYATEETEFSFDENNVCTIVLKAVA